MNSCENYSKYLLQFKLNKHDFAVKSLHYCFVSLKRSILLTSLLFYSWIFSQFNRRYHEEMFIKFVVWLTICIQARFGHCYWGYSSSLKQNLWVNRATCNEPCMAALFVAPLNIWVSFTCFINLSWPWPKRDCSSKVWGKNFDDVFVRK